MPHCKCESSISSYRYLFFLTITNVAINKERIHYFDREIILHFNNEMCVLYGGGSPNDLLVVPSLQI